MRFVRRISIQFIFVSVLSVLMVSLMPLTPARAASEMFLERWPIPEYAPYNNIPADPRGNGFVAPNGDYWFITQKQISASTTERRVWVVDKNTGAITNPFGFTYAGPGNGYSPSESHFYGFISDSTGKVWYTGADYRLVPINIVDGKPVSAGTEIPLPPAPGVMTSNWGPEYILVGSNDTFWYADKIYSSGNVRIRNTQQNGTLIDEYFVPVSSIGSGIEGMEFGSDGNLWLGSRLSSPNSVIVKLDITTKLVTTYSTQSKGFRTQIRTLGPDGNIWFTVSASSFYDSPAIVGKITPSGTITYYDSVLATYLVSGHENNIVFRGGATQTTAEIQSIDTTTLDIKTYNDLDMFPAANNWNQQASMVKGHGGSYWYTFRYPTTQSGYTSGATYGVGRATIDYTGPTVSITSPASGSLTNASTLPVTVPSTDPSGVASLELFSGSSSIATVTTPGTNHTFSWNISALADGPYILSAKSIDTLANQTTSSGVTVTIDHTNPTASITSPASGATVNGTIVVSANGSDVNGIASIAFSLDGVSTSTDTTPPYSFAWNTVNTVNGNHTLTALVTDNAGNTTTVSQNVNVYNQPPPEDTTTLCHFPGTQGQFTLTVNNSAVRSHLGHGDYIGGCEPLGVNEITTVVDTKGETTKTVAEGADLATTNLDVQQKETLVVNGTIGEITAKPGATVKGSGQMKSLTIQQGAFLAPGQSPGCLTSEELKLDGTYRFEAQGNVACTEYDQAIVRGTVTISGQLSIELLKGFRPKVGDAFIIINNDEIDKTIGSFTNIKEGETLKLDSISYTITYSGADGNDVVLSVTGIDPAPTEQDTASTTKSNKTLTYVVGAALIITGLYYIVQSTKKNTTDTKK